MVVKMKWNYCWKGQTAKDMICYKGFQIKTRPPLTIFEQGYIYFVMECEVWK